MPVEIERKFLVDGDGWRAGNPPGARFCQGYLAEDCATVRVRRMGNRACVTIKGRRRGIARPEFEYLIPVDHAEELFRLCRKPLIEKTRYSVRHGGHCWAVDVFAGNNAGLVLAEIELGDPDEHFVRPEWVGREVTCEDRYRNSMLSIAPIHGSNERQHSPRETLQAAASSLFFFLRHATRDRSHRVRSRTMAMQPEAASLRCRQ